MLQGSAATGARVEGAFSWECAGRHGLAEELSWEPLLFKGVCNRESRALSQVGWASSLVTIINIVFEIYLGLSRR